MLKPRDTEYKGLAPGGGPGTAGTAVALLQPHRHAERRNFDRLSLTQARQRCRVDPRDEGCLQKPVKLYLAAVKSGADPQGRYDKVIAVMSERNWTLPSPKLPVAARERVHGGVNDLNNVSTEIAMCIVDAAWLPR